VIVSHDVHDERWDAFVAEAQGGYYMQTTAWSRLKSRFDWSVARVMVIRQGVIVAGAQVLLRRLPLGGSIAWAPRAPLFGVADPLVVRLVLDELHRLGRRSKVRVLLVQPAVDDPLLREELDRRGYRPTPVIMAPSWTVVFDLSKPLDDLMAAMSKHTRRNVRKGLRDGVRVREGDERDVQAFYELHAGTSRRQRFSSYPESYFAAMWEAFRPDDGCRLFLAEYDGEILSGLFVLALGDTIYSLASGWSGRHASRKPNDVLHWELLKWGKEHGYRVCDLVWIDPRVGEAIARGEPVPEDLHDSASSFKLRLGGVVTHFPRGYDYVFNPALRLVYRALLPRLYRWPSVKARLFELRWRWSTSLRSSPGSRER
jgi:lipid II:glycine glycyltransferase (peptidoglycan interpeptide bridge formation enzyme)